MNKPIIYTLLTILVLFLIGLGGYNFYLDQKEQKEVKLLSAILSCSSYSVGYSDALENKTPAIGSFMSVENQKLLESSRSEKERKEVDFVVFNTFVSAYRLGYNDAKEQKKSQAEEMISQLIKENPDRKEYIQDIYKKLQELKKQQFNDTGITN